MKPLISISGSEPQLIKRELAEISWIDEQQIYPDYRIYSKLDFTVGIARAQVQDLVSNKSDVASHVAEELSNIDDDVRIFLMEEWLGRDRHGMVSLPGGRYVDKNYIAIVNQVMAACLAVGAIWVPSANLKATCALLTHWNNEFFQREKHTSLMVRPRRASKVFTLDLSREDQTWWLTDIPGLNIGFTRAESMLEHAGSLISLFIMTRAELAKIEGVGPSIANKFRKFIDGK